MEKFETPTPVGAVEGHDGILAHLVPWPKLPQQTLEWLDLYLGPVRN